ncbi:MAG: antibiotic biosynthesis monooxygenase family protein [Gammaproteobacteria bacterium]
MYIAINRFRIARGQEARFEEIWRNRKSYLNDVPGFIAFNLLRGAAGDEATVFLSHSQWESEQAFADWTRSEAFKLAHKQARSPEGVLLGPPQFEGYSSVELASDA